MENVYPGDGWHRQLRDVRTTNEPETKSQPSTGTPRSGKSGVGNQADKTMKLHFMIKDRLGFVSEIAAVLLLVGVTQPSRAAFDLAEYAVNVNGNVTLKSFPAGFDSSGFDLETGLGTVTTKVVGPTTAAYFGFYVDIDIDDDDNTFFNEYGVPYNSPSTIQTWEIDEPVGGDIYSNFMRSSLDNINNVTSDAPDDVAMALAWSLTLSPTEMATIGFHISPTAPLDGSSFLYLQQADTVSPWSIYFWSTLDIQPVPEPGTALAGFLLLIVGIISQLRARSRTMR